MDCSTTGKKENGTAVCEVVMEKIYRYGWAALAAAMAGDILVSWILPLLCDGCSLKLSVSALGSPQSSVRLPFNIWMLAEGLLFIYALPAVYSCYREISVVPARIMAACIAVFAVGACIFTCFFSVNETKDIVTPASIIHGIGSALGFMALLAVPLLVSLLSYKGGERGIAALGAVSFALALISFVLFVMSDKDSFAGTVIDNEGIWERLCLIFMYLPFLAVCASLLKDGKR